MSIFDTVLNAVQRQMSEGRSTADNGENQPVNGAQIQNILGLPVVQNFAEKLGINTRDAAQHLATMLPQVQHFIRVCHPIYL